MKKINLMHIAEGVRWAGIESHIFSLLSEIRNMPEVNNVIFISLYNGLLRQKLMDMGIRAFCLPRRKKIDCSLIFQIKKQIESFEVDILHTHGYLASIYGMLAALFASRKVHIVRTIHQRAEPHDSWKMNLYVRLTIFLSRLERTHLIAVSDNVKESAVKKFNINEDIITTIHNGINFRDKRVLEKDKGKLNLDPAKHTIGIVGRLVHGKGHLFFVKLAFSLIKERDNIEFVILGDGPLRENIDTFIKQQGMENKIKLMGYKDNILDYINSLDILVICSEHEGIPYVLLEALMLKKPVVSTRVGGIPEVITSGYNGILIKPGDIEAMKNGLLELIDTPSKMILLGCNGYNIIAEKFSSYNMARNTVNLYMKLISTGKSANDA